MTNESTRDWLALWLTPGIGPKSFFQLTRRFGTPAQVLKQPVEVLKQVGIPSKTALAMQHPNWSLVDQNLQWENHGHQRLITLNSDDYPTYLQQIPDPPPILFARGDITLLHSPQIAIVGSRNPSTEGRRNAHMFSSTLAQLGLTITSGLAMGIDGTCHESALDNNGKTIAVMGTGIDTIYPSKNRALAHRIADQGLIITEYPLGTRPRASNFPRRNRIISGLSLGVLVIEAAMESGSLISARMALEQNREVFAIPGSINNPLARGCNNLIRQGAKLVETAQDIAEELNFSPVLDPLPIATGAEVPLTNLDSDHLRVLKSVAYAPTPMDTLVSETGLGIEALSSILLLLELQGLISSAAGGCYYRTG